METKTETMEVPLMILYHMTYDGIDTGYNIDQVRELIEEHKNDPDYKIEITVTTPVPDIQPQSFNEEISEQVIETTAQEVVEG